MPSACSLACARSAGVKPRRGRPGRCSGPPEAALRQPAPARHSRRPLRSRRLSRARPGQTGGDPAAPGWHRARLNPAQPGRSCARPARRRGRRALSRSRLALTSRPAVRLLASPQGGRMAPRCAKPWARPEGRGVCLAHGSSNGGNARLGRAASRGRRAALRSAKGLRCEPSGDRSGGALLLPAPWTTPRLIGAARRVPLLAPTPRVIGSAPSSLRPPTRAARLAKLALRRA